MKGKRSARVFEWAAAVAAIAAVTALGKLVGLNATAIGFVFLVVVLLLTMWGGLALGLAMSPGRFSRTARKRSPGGILRGSRLAGRMNTAWFVLYVRQKKEHPHNISAAEHRRLSENVQLAMSLGATVVTRESEDVVGTILDFLRSEHISLLLVGRPTVHLGLIRRVVPSNLDRLIDRASAVDIFVVDADTPTLV